MSALGAVIRKELVDNLRDRRALMSGVLFPLMGPLLFGALFSVMAGWMRGDRPLTIAVAGAENAPHLVEFLERYGAHVTPAPDGYEQRIKDDDLDVVLVVPKEFGRDFEHGHRAELRLIFDESHNDAQTTVQRTRRLLEGFSREIGTLRLLARGIAPELAAPLQIEDVDLATSQKKAANLLNMIPLFILLSAFIGGMHVAIDTTAGERERGSLEPLLINPVSRWSLALGKWFSGVLTSWASVIVCVAGFAIALRRVPLQDLGIRAEFGAPEITGTLLVAFPLSLLSVGLMMLVATFARSFKEAQTYCQVLQLVPSVPGMLLTFSPFKVAAWMAAVPVLGQLILISQVLRAELVKPSWFALAIGCSIAGGLLCLGACVRLFRHEKIVFGR